jgi:transaldolase
MPDTVRARYAEAQAVLDELGRLGISYDEVVLQLEREGVAAFEKSWAELLDAVQGALDAARSR